MVGGGGGAGSQGSWARFGMHALAPVQRLVHGPKGVHRHQLVRLQRPLEQPLQRLGGSQVGGSNWAVGLRCRKRFLLIWTVQLHRSNRRKKSNIDKAQHRQSATLRLTHPHFFKSLRVCAINESRCSGGDRSGAPARSNGGGQTLSGGHA